MMYKVELVVLAFFLGASFASAFCCLRIRCKNHESWVTRSHCDSCGHVLGCVDLIPVLGYLIRGGKCKYCGAKIPHISFLWEAVTGIIFSASALLFLL